MVLFMGDTMPPRKGLKDVVRNPAAAALGVGADPEKWTGAAIIGRLSAQYTTLVQEARTETDLGRSNRARLFWAQAAVFAQVVAEYHQEHADAEAYTRWEHRAIRAQSYAFRAQNKIVENLHAGLEEVDPTERHAESK
jgi:hypothetical protein